MTKRFEDMAASEQKEATDAMWEALKSKRPPGCGAVLLTFSNAFPEPLDIQMYYRGIDEFGAIRLLSATVTSALSGEINDQPQ